jgi:hypothetical protein
MRSVSARRLLTAVFLSLVMIATATPASAGGWGHHGYKSHGHRGHGHYYKPFKQHYGYRHHRHHRHHRNHGNDIVIGAGIIGGAIIVGSVLSRPQPAPPSVVYVTPPPQPYCVQDQVYRYLPDGSVQWGTRTRCY